MSDQNKQYIGEPISQQNSDYIRPEMTKQDLISQNPEVVKEKLKGFIMIYPQQWGNIVWFMD